MRGLIGCSFIILAGKMRISVPWEIPTPTFIPNGTVKIEKLPMKQTDKDKILSNIRNSGFFSYLALSKIGPTAPASHRSRNPGAS